jgi:D-sedoheptulose 7-phosphate isomerase
MKGSDRTPESRAKEILQESAETHARAAETLPEVSARVARLFHTALVAGGKVLLCGNGGSAADAQHIAAELAGRLRHERKGLAAIALTVNSSILTAVSNDYGYDAVFERQVEALGRPGDVLVGISTSGTSANVIAALRKAREMGLGTVGFAGENTELMAELCDVIVSAPTSDTQRIQEIHIAVGHVVCELVESRVAPE